MRLYLNIIFWQDTDRIPIFDDMGMRNYDLLIILFVILNH